MRLGRKENPCGTEGSSTGLGEPVQRIISSVNCNSEVEEGDSGPTFINPMWPKETFEIRTIVAFSAPRWLGFWMQLIHDTNVSPALIKLGLSSREGEITPI